MASFAAALTGSAAALSIAALPAAWLDRLVSATALPQVVAAATPPIGVTGRSLLALGIGVTLALAAYIAVRRRRNAPDAAHEADFVSAPHAPVLRRADAHPDAPSRRPIRASEDLGPPLPIAAASPAPRNYEQPLPADLEMPLAAFDPAALPATPAEPVRPVAPLAVRRALIDPGERFETFELTPAVRPARPAIKAEPPSIGALLDRLERSARQSPRGRADVGRTVGALRGLAAG